MSSSSHSKKKGKRSRQTWSQDHMRLVDYRTQRNEEVYLQYIDSESSDEPDSHELDESGSLCNYDVITSLVCDSENFAPHETFAQGNAGDCLLKQNSPNEIDDNCSNANNVSEYDCNVAEQLLSDNSNEDHQMWQENEINSQLSSGTTMLNSQT